MIDKAKTLDECFKELILKRGWSKNSPYDRRTASRHKKLFLEGALPDEFKRIYLKSAGYTIVQPELWRQELSNRENGLEEHNKKSIRNYHCYF